MIYTQKYELFPDTYIKHHLSDFIDYSVGFSEQFILDLIRLRNQEIFHNVTRREKKGY